MTTGIAVGIDATAQRADDRRPSMRVLFVDDDERVLSGLRRMMRPYRSSWEMRFVNTAEAAIAHMEQEPCDVIVSDLSLPGVDGIDLLEHVAVAHPNVIRIILSGRTDADARRRATGVAHQFLAKPTSADELRETVQRSAGMRAALADSDLVKAIAATKSLPSAPTLYHELTTELRSPDPSLHRVGDIVARDPAMSAKLLQMVNSAFFGLRRRITDVHQAATLLGTDTIAALALSVHVFAEAHIPRALSDHVDALWRRSLSVATMAKELMARTYDDPAAADDAFLAGLLHDCGKLVLVANFADTYAALVESGADCHTEKLHLGASHAEIGAHLLALWGLPDTIVEAVAFHHNPMAGPTRSLSPLTVVHAAVALEDRAPTALPPWDVAYLDAAGQLDALPRWLTIAQNVEYERDMA